MGGKFDQLVLTPDQMAAVDGAAAETGMTVEALMERAGAAVAASALRRFPMATRFVILCGPGNNGGDGYVAARYLSQAGTRCAVHRFGADERMSEAAKWAWASCGLESRPLQDYRPMQGDVVIDALFGAGLGRDLPEGVARTVRAVETAGIPVLAVDLPSGICGRRGTVLGAAFRAEATVTFMAPKPGHLLLPGKSLCGDIELADIGIPARILHAHAGAIRVNRPAQWLAQLPVLSSSSHKYRRGHLGVFCGPAGKTGAARLCAQAGLRAGAGLVTLAASAAALAQSAPALAAVMLREIETTTDLSDWLADVRLSAFVLGPGFGVGATAREFVHGLGSRPLVLDADGITSFREDPAELYRIYRGGEARLVLTPHEGEFARLFPDLAARDDLGKLERAALAAERANGVIVYKGGDTVIAGPDGRILINDNAPPWLATAGSGDVLAGMIGALLAQGVPAFEAAAAGVYLHGEAGHAAGRNLTADDLALHAGAGFSRLGQAVPL